MKAIKNFIWSLLAEDGKMSSKRFAGIVSTLFLCITLLANSFYSNEVKPADILVECVTIVAVGSLGISSVQTIFKKGNNESDKT